MREAIYLAIAVIAFVAAIFVPSAMNDDGEGADEDVLVADGSGGGRVLHAGAPPRNTTADSASNWNAGETLLERSGDGHFYAQVSVNGGSIDVLVDTGASMVALTGNDAQTLGLSWNDSDVRVIGSGANGPVHGVPVTLERIELGGHEAHDVEAVIVPEGLGITLLGQSFLRTIDPVRIEGDTMVLGGG